MPLAHQRDPDPVHAAEHVLTSFEALFPAPRSGGVYVVEDLQASFWPSYRGDSRDLNSPNTSMGFLKSLTDGLNQREYAHHPEYTPSYTDPTCRRPALLPQPRLRHERRQRRVRPGKRLPERPGLLSGCRSHRTPEYGRLARCDRRHRFDGVESVKKRCPPLWAKSPRIEGSPVTAE
jgi:hypothetical protein